MYQNNNKFYDKFHINTGIQNKVIKKNNFTYRTLIKVIEKYIKFEDKILDIGCGAGTIDFYLASLGYEIKGIDISQKSIVACKESSIILRLEPKLVFQTIEFPNKKPEGKFDLIICSEVIEHIFNDEKAVKAIYNLLSSCGFLILSVPSKNAPLYKIGLATEFDKKVGHLRRYSLEDINNLFTKAGFITKDTIKTEGLMRNVLFLNKTIGKVIKLLNKFGLLSEVVTFFDNLSIPLFGESNIIIVAQKNEKILHPAKPDSE